MAAVTLLTGTPQSADHQLALGVKEAGTTSARCTKYAAIGMLLVSKRAFI
jgi:hypothetical protein